MTLRSSKTWPLRLIAWPGLLLVGFQATHFQTARELYTSGRFKDALLELEVSANSHEASPLRPLYTAMCDEQLGKWSEAEGQLVPYLAANPLDADAWYWLGNAQLLQRKFETSRNSFLRATELDSKSTLFHRGLGLAQLELKDYQSAYASWIDAAQLDPKEEKSRYYLGRLFYEADLPSQAAVWLREALSLAPKDFEALTYLGLCAEALDLDDTAIQLYRKAVSQSEAQSKPYAKAFLSLGNYLKMHGDEAGALAVFEEGAQECPEPHELSAFGALLAVRHQSPKAEAVLRRAIALDPALSQPHYRLSLLLASLGRAEESHVEMTKFQEAKREEDKAPKITALQK